MSTEIYQEVRRIWTEWIGLPEPMTAAEREVFLAERYGEICARIEVGMGTAQGPLLAKYQEEHGGDHPDFRTAAAMIAAGRRQVTEIVMREMLYEKIPGAYEPYE